MGKPEKKRGRPRDEELVERRCEEILAAAGRIFAEHGYAGTDLQVVANELGVGKGTLYRYFPSKRELFLAAVDRGVRQLDACIEAILAESRDPLESFRRSIQAYLGFFDENPHLVELISQERAAFKDRKKPTYFVHREAAGGKRLELLQAHIDEGRFRSIAPKRIIDVVGNLLYGTVVSNYFAGSDKSLEEQAEDILDIVFNGILSDSERARHKL